MDTENIQPDKAGVSVKNDQNSRENKNGKSKGSKAVKSNKTAHVLSLLTDNREREPEAPRKIPASPLTKIPSSPMGLADDETVAGQIRSALEEELQEELQEDLGSGTSHAEIPMTTQPLSEKPALNEQTQTESALNEPLQNESTLDETTQEEAPQTAPPTPDQMDVTAEKEAFFAADCEKSLMPPSVINPEPLTHISYVNVMQSLVEEKVDKYIRLFNLCTCPRCKIDVIALTLSNLPPKYVVVQQNEAIPMLSVYESRYNAMVISQVMWACKKVMDNPRHSIDISADDISIL